MQSISVFDPRGLIRFREGDLKNVSTHTEQLVNDVTERLTFDLYVNEKIGNYTSCRIRMDEVISLRARVLNTEITEVVVNNAYEIFINEEDSRLIILANKKSAESIQQFITTSFNLEYEKKRFDLMSIIEDSSNVKRAQFRNLLIETINGSSLSGNRVTDTEMYELMLNAGELSTIAVVYPFNNIEIKFSISDSGSIVLFSTIIIDEVLNWIDILLN